VDATPIGAGRAPEKLADLAGQCGLNVIMASGSFGYGPGKPPLPAFPKPSERFLTCSVMEMAELFYNEIQTGVFEGDFRAGVIKVASSYNTITEFEDKLFRSAAIASTESGCPVTTHCEHGTMGYGQAQILLRMGVPPENIIIGHLDLNPDIEYYRRIASLGVWLQFDRMGRDQHVKDSERIDVITRLAAEGSENQILLGSDMGSRKYWKAYGGSPGLEFLLLGFPRLLERNGMKGSTIAKITSTNPGKALSFKKR
jgi:phosphotriesterase-related protein